MQVALAHPAFFSPSPAGRRCREAADEGGLELPMESSSHVRIPLENSVESTRQPQDPDNRNGPHPAFGHLLPQGEGMQVALPFRVRSCRPIST